MDSVREMRTSPGLTRRGWLGRLGLAVAGAAVGPMRPRSVLAQAPGLSGPFDPLPDPLLVGWRADGGVNFSQPGEPLVIDDFTFFPSPEFPKAYLTFFCENDALFAGDFTLRPQLVLDAGATLPNPGDGNTGVHVTLNSGEREIRAVCFAVGGGLEIRLRTLDGFTSDKIVMGGLATAFTLTRRAADGWGILAVEGQAPVQVPFPGLPLPLVQRAGRAIEFGTYDTPAKSKAWWSTLGLPRRTTFAAGLDVRHLRIRDAESADRLRFRAALGLAASSDGIDPATEPVTLVLWTPAGGEVYRRQLAPGSFFLDSDHNPPVWTLTQTACAASGIERLDVLQPHHDGDAYKVVFVDRRTELAPLDLSTTDVRLTVGNDEATARLSLQPVAPGRWKLDR